MQSEFVFIYTSMMFPLIIPPVSAAVAYPYPGTYTLVPSLITLGSTAITPLAAFLPLAVVPPPEYA